MASTQAPDPGADSLEALEEKIRRAVELVHQLRREKEQALRSSSEVESLQARVAELSREVETLRAERETVRKRVGKLVEQIDALHAL